MTIDEAKAEAKRVADEREQAGDARGAAAVRKLIDIIEREH